MAIKTWNLRQVTTGGTPASVLWWDEAAAATAATSVSGWTVAKTALGNYANLTQGSEVATFSTTIVPNTTAPAVSVAFAATATYTPPTLLENTNSISTLYEYNGDFDAGTWTFNFPVIAVSSGGDQDGRIAIRVFKGLRSGNTWASVTELTAARLVGSTVTNLTTTTAQTSTVTWAASAFALQNEFLIIKVGWEITGAGTNNNRDVLLRWGTGASIVSPSFRKQRHILNG